MKSHVAVGSVVLGFAFALSAIADVNYWQSATLDGRWDDATRWSLKKVPRTFTCAEALLLSSADGGRLMARSNLAMRL